MQDMTEGSISSHLIKYAVPMILGNLLQLTYNAADSVIIGKCLGEQALAAVSTAGPIMTVMILGASGIGIGASVIMSRFYGAKDMESFRREFSTTVIFSTLFSLAVFVLGFGFSAELLKLMNTPGEILDMAVLYLRIIFVGFLFTFQYNILSHSMRSIGDSKTPVRFLTISCVLNICMDVLFVAVLGLGVAGAALATTLSEAVSVILCIRWIGKRLPELCLKRDEFVVDKGLLFETLQSGSLTALQQAAQPVGKVLIQSVINMQGVVAIGAFNAVCRIDDFARIPTQSMGSAIMTCTAQNRGAGHKDRMLLSFRKGVLLILCYFPVICGITLIFKTPFMRLLCPNESLEMVEMGVTYLSVKAFFFVMPCLTNSVQGFFRGLGHMSVVLAATVIQISVRTLGVFWLVPRIGITGEAYASFLGWFLMLIFEGCWFIVFRRRGEF